MQAEILCSTNSTNGKGCFENKEPNLAFYGTNTDEKSAHGKEILDNRILLETIINPQ